MPGFAPRTLIQGMDVTTTVHGEHDPRAVSSAYPSTFFYCIVCS